MDQDTTQLARKARRRLLATPSLNDAELADPTAAPAAPCTIYTAGHCERGRGPGGWAYVALIGGVPREESGEEPRTTPLCVELLAAIRGLVASPPGSAVRLITNAQAVQHGMATRHGLGAAASRRPVGEDEAGDLWDQLRTEAARREVEWAWLRVYATKGTRDHYDARVYQLAHAAARRATRHAVRGAGDAGAADPDTTASRARMGASTQQAAGPARHMRPAPQAGMPSAPGTSGVRDGDPYDILGLTRDADARAIKAAFRRQAHRYHPDANGGDVAAGRAFEAIHAAYQTLSVPERRRAYDAATAGSAAGAQEEGTRWGAGRRLGAPGLAALARAARLAHALRDSGNSRARRAVIVGAGALLVCLLLLQLIHPSDPRATPPGRTAGQFHGRQAAVAAHHLLTRAAIHHTPVYLLGGCLRYCPPTPRPQPSHGAAPPSTPARRAAKRPQRPPQPRPRRPRPHYLFGNCISRCPSPPPDGTALHGIGSAR